MAPRIFYLIKNNSLQTLYELLSNALPGTSHCKKVESSNSFPTYLDATKLFCYNIETHIIPSREFCGAEIMINETREQHFSHLQPQNAQSTVVLKLPDQFRTQYRPERSRGQRRMTKCKRTTKSLHFLASLRSHRPPNDRRPEPMNQHETH